MAPVQARIMDISEKSEEYCHKVFDMLLEAGLRPEKDLRPEKIGTKIRDAQLEKIPYMLIVGAKEQECNSVSVRNRKGEDLGVMTIDEMLAKFTLEIATKAK
jgi:threonyl-tRNA synthetase